ncbi:MAG: FimB/Mfa2 family fimbrial subunit [Mucinivorans sp.]
MKKILFLTLIAPLMVVSCHRDTTICPDPNPPLEFGTIKFTALQANKAYTGALEMFPCKANTTLYVGNYIREKVSVINPSCVVNQGMITTWGYQLWLPLGSYNMVYWGVGNSQTYGASMVEQPTLTLGGDVSPLFWSLKINADQTTYMPVLDQVMAVQNVAIGGSSLSVNLARMVAGLNVVIKNSTAKPLDTSINSIEVMVGGIAEKLNFVTGAPINQTKTVRFALTIDPKNRTQASNQTAMLYPSIQMPQIVINIYLSNGQKKSYETKLKNAFTANSIQTITILIGDILASDPTSTAFTIDHWQETSQTIDVPLI